MQKHAHSGALGPALLTAPIVCGLGAALLALIYAYVVVWSPIAGVVSVLFVFGIAVGLFSLVAVSGTMLKSRAPWFMTAVGISTGVLALYTHWAFFEYALLSRYEESFDLTMLDFLLSPSAVWALVLEINDSGWFSISGGTPTGAVLWAFWGIEALMILAAPALAGAFSLSDEVFCERCNVWAKEVEPALLLALPEDDMEIQQDNVDWLVGLDPLVQGTYPVFRGVLKSCPNCENTTALKLEMVTAELDKDGNFSENTAQVIPTSTTSTFEHAKLKEAAARTPEVPIGADVMTGTINEESP